MRKIDSDIIDILVSSWNAMVKAIPYIAPIAEKNSSRGDEAMAVLSHLMNAIDRIKRLDGEQK